MPKHSGCWYCGNTNQEILESVQRRIIDRDGKSSTYAVALCRECTKATTLDQRVPTELRIRSGSGRSAGGGNLMMKKQIEKSKLLQLKPDADPAE